MSADPAVRSWTGSYYLNGEKRWRPGRLSLTATRLRFQLDGADHLAQHGANHLALDGADHLALDGADHLALDRADHLALDGADHLAQHGADHLAQHGADHLALDRADHLAQHGADHLALDLPLSCIDEIKKESSSYIFSAITVLAGGGDKHWLGSLAPSRNAVFTVLEHFWRQQLLAPRGEDGTTSTSRGAQLITIMSGSQRRMEDTTRVLHHQGEQLGSITCGLNKIEGDMATADRLLSVLESPSWWPFSRSPWKRPVTIEAQVAAPTPGKDGVITIIPVVFSRLPDVALRPGHLTLLLSALEISDCDRRLVQRYERQEVDDIRVMSGHEMRVRQRFIGRPDVTCSVISARLPDILPLLQMQYKSKMEVLEEAAVARDRSPGWQTDSWLLDTIVRSAPCRGEEQIQDQEVTDAEEQELRKILMKLKCMALEAEGELERQDEALDDITGSTDRAIINIDKQTRRMRNLL